MIQAQRRLLAFQCTRLVVFVPPGMHYEEVPRRRDECSRPRKWSDDRQMHLLRHLLCHTGCQTKTVFEIIHERLRMDVLIAPYTSFEYQ